MSPPVVHFVVCVLPQIFGRFYTVLSVAAPVFGRFYAVLPVAASKIRFLSVIGSPGFFHVWTRFNCFDLLEEPERTKKPEKSKNDEDNIRGKKPANRIEDSSSSSGSSSDSSDSSDSSSEDDETASQTEKSGKSDADDKVREHVKRMIEYSELLPPSPWAQNYWSF